MKGVIGADLLAAATLTLFLACSSKETTIGQTHIVTCHSDADCTSLGSEYSCQGETCLIRTREDSGVSGCGAGCVEALGYPVDYMRSCVDLSKKELIGCLCEGSASSNCRIRKSDGKIFLGDATSLFRPDDFQECGAGGDPTIVPENSCDFANCATPPPSSCSLADTCTVLPCNTPEFDSNGCKRTFCSNDSDCSSTDRCVFTQCQNASACSYAPDGTCQCGGPEFCHSGHFCNPTADYGPRGDWTALEFTQASGPCPTPGGCTSTWRLTPDGHLALSKFGTPSTATVDAGTLETIRGFIDGPELRPALRDGLQCDPPPTDVFWSVTLELSTVTLQSDATGCLTTGPSGNIAQQIFDYLKNY